MALKGKRLLFLAAFMKNPRDEISGAQLSKMTKTGSGTLYPILRDFEDMGLLDSRWEEIDPKAEGRPRRRLYRITADGQNQATEALREISEMGGFAWI